MWTRFFIRADVSFSETAECPATENERAGAGASQHPTPPESPDDPPRRTTPRTTPDPQPVRGRKWNPDSRSLPWLKKRAALCRTRRACFGTPAGKETGYRAERVL